MTKISVRVWFQNQIEIGCVCVFDFIQTRSQTTFHNNVVCGLGLNRPGIRVRTV